MNWELVVDIIGWIGSFEVVAAYALISSHKLTAKSIVYQLLNLTGGIFLIINTVYYGSYPSTFINVVWMVIAIGALYKIWRSYRGEGKEG